MQSEKKRNRRRSKRRAIFCPYHGCYMDSVSQKFPLYADKVEHLREQGINRINAVLLMSSQTVVPLDGQWMEAFWCAECQCVHWFHVFKLGGTYHLKLASRELWQRATGVINPEGNTSVGEFTRRHSRMARYNQVNQFNFCG